MKRFLAALFAVCTSLSLFAQDYTFEKGDKVANFGLGIGSTLGYGTTAVPPLSASFEVGVVDKIIDKGVIGVGGYLGFSSYKYVSYKLSNFVIGPRGTFHYPFINNLDTYAGLMIGYNLYHDNWDYGPNYGGIVSSWFLGGRYYFSNNLAAMLELGYGVAYLNIGVALKF
jgi:hypothetical protein